MRWRRPSWRPGTHPPLEIVPGIEINTDDPGGEIHVLGYFLDHEALWLLDLLREFRAERAARVHRIAERLAALGHPIDAEEVLALVQEGSAGRPHVAQVMVRRGYVGTVREAFDRFLGRGQAGVRAPPEGRSPGGVRDHPPGGRPGGRGAPGVSRGPRGDDPGAGRRRASSTASSATTPSTPRSRRRGSWVSAGSWTWSPTGGSDFHGPRVRAATAGPAARSLGGLGGASPPRGAVSP